MPPLPTTAQEETANIIELLTRRQKDLQDFQIPRLRDFKGSLATQQKYASELQEDLEVFARNVQDLNSLADDLVRARERQEVVQKARQFETSLDQMRKDTRVALLTSKRAIDASARSSRDELLRSTVMSEKAIKDVSENALVNASNDVTEALRRTVGLMQSELERSVLSSQMLEQSSANLRSATAAHDTLSSLLSTSKHLITALEKSDWLDRLLIFAALAFFFLVVLFILKQRVVDKGLRIAFWWTRLLPPFTSNIKAVKVATSSGVTLTTVVAASTPSAISFIAATSTSGLSSLPESTDTVIAVVSTPLPSHPIIPTPSTLDIDDSLLEFVHSTTVQSQVVSETGTVLQSDKYKGHLEL